MKHISNSKNDFNIINVYLGNEKAYAIFEDYKKKKITDMDEVR